MPVIKAGFFRALLPGPALHVNSHFLTKGPDKPHLLKAPTFGCQLAFHGQKADLISVQIEDPCAQSVNPIGTRKKP